MNKIIFFYQIKKKYICYVHNIFHNTFKINPKRQVVTGYY